MGTEQAGNAEPVTVMGGKIESVRMKYKRRQEEKTSKQRKGRLGEIKSS